jgi:hypothetical protein
MNPTVLDRYISTSAFAAELKIPRGRVWRYAKAGKIPSVVIAGRIRLDRETLPVSGPILLAARNGRPRKEHPVRRRKLPPVSPPVGE